MFRYQSLFYDVVQYPDRGCLEPLTFCVQRQKTKQKNKKTKLCEARINVKQPQKTKIGLEGN